MEDTKTTATDVATLLREFERRIDLAYSAFGDLASALPRARMEARLSAVVGQSVIERVGDAGAAIGAARGHAVIAHRLLERIAKTIGMDDGANLGDERPKPDVFTTGKTGTEVVSFGRRAA